MLKLLAFAPRSHFLSQTCIISLPITPTTKPLPGHQMVVNCSLIMTNQPNDQYNSGQGQSQ